MNRTGSRCTGGRQAGSAGNCIFSRITVHSRAARKTTGRPVSEPARKGVVMAEFKLGNKALELYRYTLQVTRPVADEKVDAKDVAKVLRTIARADTIEEMRGLLLKTADRLEKKPGRPRFPKSESFGMIADLRGAARNIVRGVHAANETIFTERPEERLKEIKAVIDECNLMLQLVALSEELKYADIKRVETWTNKILDVKRMCLAWMKKDGERAKKILAEKDREKMTVIIALVRDIMAAEAAGKTKMDTARRQP